mmetsp:Transcript_21617/g.38359  ORF Transcript_21617/g.38359 Transcript_21617/m.38359 type:complete len:197 (-) Transcript_21617:108-698(-)
MGRFYCDYCDIFLTHDNRGGRKQHCAGRKHLENVYSYYNQLGLASQQQLAEMMYRQSSAGQRTQYNDGTAIARNTADGAHMGTAGFEASKATGGGMPEPAPDMTDTPWSKGTFDASASPLVVVIFILAFSLVRAFYFAKESVAMHHTSIAGEKDDATLLPISRARRCKQGRRGSFFKPYLGLVALCAVSMLMTNAF